MAIYGSVGICVLNITVITLAYCTEVAIGFGWDVKINIEIAKSYVRAAAG